MCWHELLGKIDDLPPGPLMDTAKIVGQTVGTHVTRDRLVEKAATVSREADSREAGEPDLAAEQVASVRCW